MKLSKELALAIDFKKAPKELQEAANGHYANVKVVEKLKKGLTEAAAKLEDAEKQAAESELKLQNALRDWEPEV
jgi:hypothetical protein